MRRFAVLLLLPAVLLTACGGNDSADERTDTSSSASSASNSNAEVPAVSGKFGQKPTVAKPSGEPSATLVDKVLAQGSGPTVAKGDLLVAHYLGETWASAKVFDNSYDRKQPAAFPIGVGSVVPGWDKGLVGKKVGSRVLLVLPPADGYGAQGQPDAGIKGTDTLLFVVDIVGTIPKADQTAHGTVSKQAPAAGLPKVSTDPTKKPVVTIAKGAKAPTQPQSAVIVTGDGAAIDPAKSLVAQIVQVDYSTGKSVYDSWTQGPQQVPVAAIPGLADAVKGQRVGSRVLLILPASAQAQTPSAVVLDIVGNV